MSTKLNKLKKQLELAKKARDEAYVPYLKANQNWKIEVEERLKSLFNIEEIFLYNISFNWRYSHEEDENGRPLVGSYEYSIAVKDTTDTIARISFHNIDVNWYSSSFQINENIDDNDKKYAEKHLKYLNTLGEFIQFISDEQNLNTLKDLVKTLDYNHYESVSSLSKEYSEYCSIVSDLEKEISDYKEEVQKEEILNLLRKGKTLILNPQIVGNRIEFGHDSFYKIKVEKWNNKTVDICQYGDTKRVNLNTFINNLMYSVSNKWNYQSNTDWESKDHKKTYTKTLKYIWEDNYEIDSVKDIEWETVTFDSKEEWKADRESN